MHIKESFDVFSKRSAVFDGERLRNGERGITLASALLKSSPLDLLFDGVFFVHDTYFRTSWVVFKKKD